jgi:CRP/FNR family cyclic AMP-dependent transcriptional regulator
VNTNERRIPDPTAVLARMGAGKSELKFHKDQALYAQGDPADSSFFVQSGSAKVTIVSPEGREAVVEILRPGDFCGEECLTGYPLRTATVTPLTECTVTRLEKASMIRALREDRTFSDLFVSHLAARIIRTQADLADQLLNSTEKRLARLLLNLSSGGEEEGLEPIIPKISQETLAEMIGTSRTHVNFFMNKFRRLGFVDYDGEFKVNRSLLNKFLRTGS